MSVHVGLSDYFDLFLDVNNKSVNSDFNTVLMLISTLSLGRYVKSDMDQIADSTGHVNWCTCLQIAVKYQFSHYA